MSPYKRGAKQYIRIPQRGRPGKIIASGTSDRVTAKAIERMLKSLADRKEWHFLEMVTQEQNLKRRRAKLTELFNAYRAGKLEELEATLDDVDLTEHIPAWQDTLRSRLRAGSRSVDRYVAVVRNLMPEGEPFPRSGLTPARIAAWQSSPATATWRTKSGQPMRIQRRLALSSFCAYLISIDVLTTNPVKQVKGAGKSEPKVQWLDVDDMMRLIEAFPEPYRTLSALLHGAGLEIGAALELRKRDIDPKHRAVHAAGTKTKDRDRVARIQLWAWPYIERHIATLLPSALLFEGIAYHTAHRAHRAACKAAGITSYTLHDARHSFAVQLSRQGVPNALIAANLGHKDEAEVVRTYGRYTVKVDDWARWEGWIAEKQGKQRDAK